MSGSLIALGASPEPTAPAVGPGSPVNVTGHWASPLDTAGIDLIQTGATVTGDSITGLHMRGLLSGDTVAFVFWRGGSYDDADDESRGAGTLRIGSDDRYATVHWATVGGKGAYNGTFVLVRTGGTPGGSTFAVPTPGTGLSMSRDEWDRLRASLEEADPEAFTGGTSSANLFGLISQNIGGEGLATLWAAAGADGVTSLAAATGAEAPWAPRSWGWDREPTPILALAAGTVTGVYRFQLGVAAVEVTDPSTGTITYYTSMWFGDVAVRTGQTIEPGQLIGAQMYIPWPKTLWSPIDGNVKYVYGEDGSRYVLIWDRVTGTMWVHDQVRDPAVSDGQAVQAGQEIGQATLGLYGEVPPQFIDPAYMEAAASAAKAGVGSAWDAALYLQWADSAVWDSLVEP